MQILIKDGFRIKGRTGFSEERITKMMEKILEEHPHLCSTCSSTACKDKRSIKSSFVVKGIHTLDRDYIFDCMHYEVRKLPDVSEIDTMYPFAKYAECECSVVHPLVKQIVNRMK